MVRLGPLLAPQREIPPLFSVGHLLGRGLEGLPVASVAS